MAKKILIVDDEKDLTSALKTLFQASEYDTDIAWNADEAQKKLKSAFDLIILDMKMPGVDGVSLLKTINKDHPIAKVIILTGYGEEYKDKVAELKYEAFLTKPFSAMALANTAQDILEGRKPEEKPSLYTDPHIMPEAKLLFIGLDYGYFVPTDKYFESKKDCGGDYTLETLFVAPKVFDSKRVQEVIDRIGAALINFKPHVVLGHQLVLAVEDIYLSIKNSRYKPKDIIIYKGVADDEKYKQQFDEGVKHINKLMEQMESKTPPSLTDDPLLEKLGKAVRETCIKNNLYEKVKESVRIPEV